MADKDKDDLADALARLAAGEHVEESHDPDASHHGHDSIEPPPKAPAKPAQPQFRQTPVSPARPAGTNPPPLVKKPATPPENRPAAPARPAAPVARAAPPVASIPAESATPIAKMPTAPSARPATPAAPNFTPPQDFQEQGAQNIVDDDAMLAPAPDASVFAPKARAAPRKARPPIFKTLEFRQTVIPVMLTTGSIMIIFSVLRIVMGSDSAFADLPIWLPITLALFGLLLLGLAVLNMIQVKKELDEKRAGKAPTGAV